MRSRKNNFVLQDGAIIVFSVLIAFILQKLGLPQAIISLTTEFQFISSFVAGMFFTSIFTTAPAMVALGDIAHHGSLFLTAFSGACGAVIGDLIIFRFVRDQLSEHLIELVKHNGVWKRIKVLLKLRYFRWFTFLVGGLVLASPLPDELGISLLGFVKTKTNLFIFISFCFNFIGILVIGLIARTLL
jgi:hypothetical protein